jgi:hypothetical protein
MDIQEIDIRDDAKKFIDSLGDMPYREKLVYLIDLLKKYAEFNKESEELKHEDFLDIISLAMSNRATNANFVHLEDYNDNFKELSYSQYNNLCVIEATIGVLHRKGCLKNVPKFKKRNTNE